MVGLLWNVVKPGTGCPSTVHYSSTLLMEHIQNWDLQHFSKLKHCTTCIVVKDIQPAYIQYFLFFFSLVLLDLLQKLSYNDCLKF